MFKKLFQRKPTNASYRKITVTEPTGKINEVFGITSERYGEMGGYLSSIVRKMFEEGSEYSNIVDLIFTDPFFKTEQEQILMLFQVGRIVGDREAQKETKGGLLSELFSVVGKVVEGSKTLSDEEFERLKKEHPEMVDDAAKKTNCGSPTCKVHGYLNKKKETKSSRPTN